jgi:hypothetical protein
MVRKSPNFIRSSELPISDGAKRIARAHGISKDLLLKLEQFLQNLSAFRKDRELFRTSITAKTLADRFDNLESAAKRLINVLKDKEVLRLMLEIEKRPLIRSAFIDNESSLQAYSAVEERVEQEIKAVASILRRAKAIGAEQRGKPKLRQKNAAKGYRVYEDGFIVDFWANKLQRPFNSNTFVRFAQFFDSVERALGGRAYKPQCTNTLRKRFAPRFK